MKKILIFLLSAFIIFIIMFSLNSCTDSSFSSDETTVDLSEENLSETGAVTSDETSESSSGNVEQAVPGKDSLLTVDSWLRICSVENIDGKLAVVAENISEKDVEYALLTLTAKEEKLTFRISALLNGEKAYLFSEKEYSAEIAESISFGTAENIIFYDKALSLNDDILEISVQNDSIAVRNISDSDITSEIVICYKEIINYNIPNGSMTGRIRLQGLNAGSLTYVKADGITENNCRIIFTQYD